MRHRWLRAALRPVVAIGLLTILILYFDPREIWANLRSITATHVALAGLVLGGQFVFSSLRWWSILRRIKAPLDGRRAVSIYGLGALANLVLVTSVAGMSVRALLLMRAGVRASTAVASLVVERMAALAGLLLCLMVGGVLSYRLLAPHLQALGGAAPIGLIALGLVCLVLVVVLLVRSFETVKVFLLQLRASFVTGAALVELGALSLCIVLFGFAAVAALANGMNVDVDALALITVLPFVAFVSALPISVGGWGVREGSMVAGLGLVGVQGEQAMAVSIAYGLVGLLVTLVLGSAAALLSAQKRDGDVARDLAINATRR